MMTTTTTTNRRYCRRHRRRRACLRYFILLVALSLWFGSIVASYRSVVTLHHRREQEQEQEQKEETETETERRRGRGRLVNASSSSSSSSSLLRARKRVVAPPTAMSAGGVVVAIADDAAEEEEEDREEPDAKQGKDGADRNDDDGDDDDPLIRPGRLPRCRPPVDVDDASLREMVYWSTIPSDYGYVSPYRRSKSVLPRRYLHVEPDDCGFNNNRMAFETAVVLAHATGRTLIVPPRRKMYGMTDNNDKDKDKDKDGGKGGDGNGSAKPKTTMGYMEYFPLKEMENLHAGIDLISTEEFLRREVLTGNLRDVATGKKVRPPDKGRTDWDGRPYQPLRKFMRRLSVHPEGWDPEECLFAFASVERSSEGKRKNNNNNNNNTDDDSSHRHRDMVRRAMTARDPLRGGGGNPVVPSMFINNPTPVNASAEDRFRELMAERKRTCLYTPALRDDDADARVLNFPVTAETKLLSHFYAAIFHDDWRVDLWYKRLIRDNMHFRDDVVCAAAGIVESLRSRARERQKKKKKKKGDGDGVDDDADGAFDAFHVRRSDFQILYEGTMNETASMILETSKRWIPPDRNRVVYVATDETDRTYFRPLEDAYDVRYLDDYSRFLGGVNDDVHSLVEMMIAARSETFVGCYWSTFTGYIHRLRGYYSQKEKLPGYENGELRRSHHYNSVSFVQKNEYRVYKAVKRPAWYREFPIAWRDIDRSVGRMDMD